MTSAFVAWIRAFDEDREVLPERRHLKTLDMSPQGMPDTEAYLNRFLEALVREDGTRPRPDQYRLEIYDWATQDLAFDWRYSPR